MKFYIETVLIFLSALIMAVDSREACEKKLHNCTGMMQPVLNEVRYMFPVTQLEIEGMCKVWSHIMDCVRKYVTDCSSEEQRTKFNEAVSNSIDSVHAICSSERYRRESAMKEGSPMNKWQFRLRDKSIAGVPLRHHIDLSNGKTGPYMADTHEKCILYGPEAHILPPDYLEYASCFRKVSMESCGNHFKKMVDSAYNPHSLEIHICCAYRQYEKCVSDPIQRLCGPQALHILDDSMSSLKSRCEAVSKSLKPTDKICPAETAVQETQEYQQPRPALRHVEQTYSPLSTSGYVMNTRPIPYTTPAWTPRTVIYPLPVTRHSSRISRSNAWAMDGSLFHVLALAIIVFIL